MKRTAWIALAAGLLSAFAAAGAGAAAPYSAVEVRQFDADKDLNVLPEFRVAMYENLIAELQKEHKFTRLYRDGELKSPTPGVMVVRASVLQFQKGSERLRNVTTVGGWTAIKIHVRLEDQATGALIAEKDLTGRVRFIGGNLRATLSLAKQVAALVAQSNRAGIPAGQSRS